MYNRILVPTDGSEDGVEEPLRHAINLAKTYQATLHVIYVSSDEDEDSSMYMGDTSPVGHDAVKTVTNRARQYGLKTETEVTHGEPVDQIVDYARKHVLDLIVMGTHARKGITRVVAGSVTEKVIRKADVPVLAVNRK